MPAILLLTAWANLPAIDPPSGLLADLIPNGEAPLVTRDPAFSWIVGPPEPASVQTAYRLQVASTKDLLVAGKPDLWDSGAVSSDHSVAVRYQGKPLVAGSLAYWRVQVADRDGQLSAFAEPQALRLATGPGHWPKRSLVTTRQTITNPTPTGAQAWAADFSTASFAWLELTFTPEQLRTIAPGTKITVRLGERRDDAGRIHRKPGGSVRFAETTVILTPETATYRVSLPPDKRNTGKEAVLLPPELGVVLPFRYAEVDGCQEAPVLTRVTVQYPFSDQAADFQSSDPTLNAVWDLCARSIQVTSFCGVYVDGDRERIAYEGDAYINQLSHYGTDREFALARATYDHLLAHPTWPTEWAQHMVLIAWADWMATGDLAAVERTWPALTKNKSLRSRMRGDGLLDTKGLRDLVDWPAGERDGFVFTQVNTVVNAFHCRVLQCLGDLAEALGKPDEAILYRKDAERAIAAFNAVLFDPTQGVYVDGEGTTHASQHANLWPLAFGLVPAERLPGVRALVIRKGMAGSVYAAQYLLEGLFLSGAADQAIARMADRGPRGWWNMMVQGSTVTMEAWDAKAKPNQDWNHAWGAAPANILPRFVLGVRPLTAGGGTVLIQPQLGPLTSVRGRVPTIRGPISVQVEKPATGKPTLDVVLPGNTTARIEWEGIRTTVGPGPHRFTAQ